MNRREWQDYIAESYQRGLDHAEDLQPRYALVFTAGIAAAAAHYAIAFGIIKNIQTECDQCNAVSAGNLTVPDMVGLCLTTLGGLAIAASIWHLADAAIFSDKYTTVGSIKKWDRHFKRQYRIAKSFYQSKPTANWKSKHYKQMKKDWVKKMKKCDRLNNKVSQSRLKSVRLALGCVFGSGMLAIAASIVQLIDRFFEATIHV